MEVQESLGLLNWVLSAAVLLEVDGGLLKGCSWGPWDNYHWILLQLRLR